jgi:hypothetical protein
MLAGKAIETDRFQILPASHSSQNDSFAKWLKAIFTPDRQLQGRPFFDSIFKI